MVACACGAWADRVAGVQVEQEVDDQGGLDEGGGVVRAGEGVLEDGDEAALGE